MIRFRPMFYPTLWFLPGVLLLAGLGAWQVERLHWKEALIASVETGMRAAPVPLAEALAKGAAESEWHHVLVRGRFLHDKESYLFAQGPMGAIGVQVVTPFLEENGETVLVDRGFVPEALRDPGTRAMGQVEGDVAVTGVLRVSQEPGLFTPAPDLAKRLWFIKNVPAIAAATGVSVAVPVLIEADATPNLGGWPLGGQTRVDFPNDHLQYAITWFGLALALTGVYLVFHVRQGRLGLK
jgi:surfeit locus 1 family protein